MRRPNRNIEIFSLSVLDLFSAAMGAFILVSLVLMPYYFRNKDARQQLHALSGKVAQCREQVATLNHSLALARGAAAQNAQMAERGAQQLRTCLLNTAKSFIVAVMRWKASGYDVDLHVVDPDGHDYYYGHKQFGNPSDPYDPQLSFDNTVGPGIEVWQDPRAVPGNYCFAFHLYASTYSAPSVVVDGRIFYKNDLFNIPAVILDKTHFYATVATLHLAADGTAAIHPGQWSCAPETAPHRPPGAGKKPGSGHGGGYWMRVPG